MNGPLEFKGTHYTTNSLQQNLGNMLGGTLNLLTRLHLDQYIIETDFGYAYSLVRCLAFFACRQYIYFTRHKVCGLTLQGAL